MSVLAIPYKFQTFSRQTMPGAPPYDPSKPVKAWVDPSPAADPVTYTILNPDYTLGTLTLSEADAKAYNLPGHPNYLPYVNPPCTGTFNHGPFPSFAVVLRADADAIASEVGADPTAITDAMDQFGNTYPIDYGSDPRRPWEVLFKGQKFLAGDLIAQKNAQGIGAPGAWDLSGAAPVWTSHIAPNAAPDNAVYLAVPLGDIPAGATVLPPSIAIPAPMLEIPDAAAPTAGGGGLTADQATQLSETHAGVLALKALFHV